MRVGLDFNAHSYTYRVKYDTVIDVLAYVGGLFNISLALCFFMKYYGELFFEFQFAELYFKNKNAKNYGILSSVKQIAYIILNKFNIEPGWSNTQ